jgi:hypothetical protein
MPVFQNPNIRRQALSAANSGQLQNFLQSHPQAAQRFNTMLGHGNQRAASIASRSNNAASPAAKPAPSGNSGQPAQAQGTGQQPKSGGGASPAPAPTTPQTFQGFLNTQFGQGNPFGLQSWYGDNPIQTAQAAANQNLGTNLAGIRAQYGQEGLGTSSREALAEGTATAQTNTQLGAQLAQLGQTARATDVGNALQATLGAGALNNQATANLAQQGAGLTGIGQGEQNLPGLGAILSLLSAFQSTVGTGGQSQSGISSKF